MDTSVLVYLRSASLDPYFTSSSCFLVFDVGTLDLVSFVVSIIANSADIFSCTVTVLLHSSSCVQIDFVSLF